MQTLREKIPVNFHFHILICETFRKQNWQGDKLITHPRTLERRASTSFENLTDNELSIFCPVLKAKVSEIRNPFYQFYFDGKKWVKEERGVGE